MLPFTLTGIVANKVLICFPYQYNMMKFAVCMQGVISALSAPPPLEGEGGERIVEESGGGKVGEGGEIESIIAFLVRCPLLPTIALHVRCPALQC